MAANEPNRQPKDARREAAREKARLLREEEQRKARHRRLAWQGGIGLAIVAVIAVVAVLIVTSIKPASPGPKNMASDAITITANGVAMRTDALSAGATPTVRPTDSKGRVVIRVYEDFLCPYCGEFESTNRAQINALVNAGKAVLMIYPVAILDSSSQGTKYSTRAANAAACVANTSPDDFLEFHRLLYANQPSEGTSGLTDSQLIAYAKQAGASSSTVASCITNGTFESWVTAATNRFLAGNLPDSNVKTVPGTPTVIVNGKQFTGSITNASVFKAFITAQS